MRGATHILALIAAILLVIAGVPTRASAAACDPCPPDCPMMATAGHAQAHHPGKPIKADSDCGQSMICQMNAAMAVAPSSPGMPEPTVAAIVLRSEAPLAPASRPPDRSLRPPIRI